MKILLTGDAAGGVGTHAQTLARALARRGHQVLLLELDGQDGHGLCHTPSGLDSGHPHVRRLRLPLSLEWQSELPPERLEADVRHGRHVIEQLAARFRPDLLHCNQFAWAGCLPCPTLLGVHSDVVSWWRTVRGEPPPDTPYHRWYRQLALTALARAEAVVAPTRATAADLALSFRAHNVLVIANGSPAPTLTRRPHSARWGAISVGRLWDRGKQLELLLGAALPMPVVLAGDLGPQPLPPTQNLRHLGQLDPLCTRNAMRAALIYVATSVYEPFGLAPLEAAQAGCALLLNDIPSFREVWGPAAFYFRHNDRGDLAAWLTRLAHDPALIRAGAQRARRRCRRYTPERMAAAYEACYNELLASPPPAHLRRPTPAGLTHAARTHL